MKKRILVLGAGFGGLELSTMLSEAFGDGIDVTLIDKSDSFYFGFSKLDVMFGHAKPSAVRLPYKNFVKPGVRLLQETISSIDPIAKRVTTDLGTHEADFLIVALGADYNFAATPGMADATEFYTLAGDAAWGNAPDVHQGPDSNRGRRGALQMPTCTQRSGAHDARLPHHSRNPQRLRNHAHPPA
jgi:NADH dehydrogenase FAD-containing subunit